MNLPELSLKEIRKLDPQEQKQFKAGINNYLNHYRHKRLRRIRNEINETEFEIEKGDENELSSS